MLVDMSVGSAGRTVGSGVGSALVKGVLVIIVVDGSGVSVGVGEGSSEMMGVISGIGDSIGEGDVIIDVEGIGVLVGSGDPSIVGRIVTVHPEKPVINPT